MRGVREGVEENGCAAGTGTGPLRVTSRVGRSSEGGRRWWGASRGWFRFGVVRRCVAVTSGGWGRGGWGVGAGVAPVGSRGVIRW